MALTPYWQFLTGLVDFDSFSNADWNRLTSAVDAQVPPFIEKMFGNGVYYGGILNTNKTVGTTRAFIYGTHVYMPLTNNAISGLTAGITNYVWLTMIQDPAHDDSPEDNVGQFTATAGGRPDNAKSIFLGTMTLNLGAVVTAIDQTAAYPADTLQAGCEHCFPLMMRRARGTLQITLSPGQTLSSYRVYNYGSHSTAIEKWYFRVPGAVIFGDFPDGWEPYVFENWAPHWFGLVLTNGSGYLTTATISWERWGLIRPSFGAAIWGRRSDPWPGSYGIPSDDEPA